MLIKNSRFYYSKYDVQWRQTLANRILALHLPGGRQLFVTTGGALWTQHRSSGVRYERRRNMM